MKYNRKLKTLDNKTDQTITSTINKEGQKMKVHSKTKTGMEVILTINNFNSPVAEITHPKLGKLSGVASWGSGDGHTGIMFRPCHNGKQLKILLTIPKSDFDTIKKESLRISDKKKEANERAQREKALAECPTGHTIATCNWSNGDLCTAEYETADGTKILASDLLESHHGWYYLPSETATIEKEKSEAKVAEKTKMEEIEAKRVDLLFASAKETGKKQVIRTIAVECNNHHEECETDILTTWAMPSGKITETRTHTW